MLGAGLEQLPPFSVFARAFPFAISFLFSQSAEHTVLRRVSTAQAMCSTRRDSAPTMLEGSTAHRHMRHDRSHSGTRRPSEQRLPPAVGIPRAARCACTVMVLSWVLLVAHSSCTHANTRMPTRAITPSGGWHAASDGLRAWRPSRAHHQAAHSSPAACWRHSAPLPRSPPPRPFHQPLFA